MRGGYGDPPRQGAGCVPAPRSPARRPGAAETLGPVNMDPDELIQAKARTRRIVSAALVRLTPGRRRAAGVAVAQRLQQLPAVRDARTLMAFLSLPTEIDTWPIIRWAWAQGKRVAVPRIEPPVDGASPAERRIVPVLLEAAPVDGVADHPAVRPGALGILEVPGAAPLDPADLDVVLAPCQAVDRRGRRLGKGGGFYDRFLADERLRAAVIAIAFHEQVLDEVPAGAGDRPVPLVVTDAETLSFAPAVV